MCARTVNGSEQLSYRCSGTFIFFECSPALCFCKLETIKISENFDIKHLRWSKIELSKEKKKEYKKSYSTTFRSSRLEMFCIKRKKKSQKNSTGNRCSCFPVNLAKFVRTPFLHKRTTALGDFLLKLKDENIKCKCKVSEAMTGGVL